MFSLFFIKEELPVLVAFFGGYIFWYKRQKGLGVFVLVLGLLFFYLEMMVFIPYFRGTGNHYPHWVYHDFGDQPGDSIRAILKNPLLPFKVLFLTWGRVQTLLFLFTPFLFLPLFSPVLLLAGPLIASKVLAEGSSYYGMIFHYSATVSPLLVMAAADGLSFWRGRLSSKSSRKSKLTWMPMAVFVFNFLLIFLNSPWRYIEHGYFWRFNQVERTAPEALALIPPTASVVTQGNIAPHLSHRRDIYSFGDYDCSVNPDFYVACEPIGAWPSTYVELKACMDQKEKAGYRRIFDKDSWIILQKSN
jgi:uncharacterized membrane protein